MPNTDFILDISKQAPTVGILVYLVFYLVRNLRDQQRLMIRNLEGREEKTANMLKEIGAECHQHSIATDAKYASVVSENSKITAHAVVVMQDTIKLLADLRVDLAVEKSHKK